MVMTTCLGFDYKASEAAELYSSLFSDFVETGRTLYPPDSPGPEGEVMTVNCRMLGQDFLFLNVGDMFQASGAVSFMVPCDDQGEIDRLWEGLQSGGGKELGCGWLTDRFGFAWQIIPAILDVWMRSGDEERVLRVMRKLWTMTKIEIAPLQAEWDSD